MHRARFTAFGTALLVLSACGTAFGQDAEKKLTRAEALSAATLKAQPEYPTVAKQLRVEGTVELEALVGEDGKVEKVTILKGNAMLTRAASDALKRWKFNPFTEAGKPVKAVAPVEFTFKM